MTSVNGEPLPKLALEKVKNNEETPLPVKEARHEPTIWKVIGGKGIEVVNETGWENYRKMLDLLGWSQLAESQISSIKYLKERSKKEASTIPNDEAMETRARIRNYVKETRDKYPRTSNLPYFAASEVDTTDTGKKLTIWGKDVPKFGKEKTTRIYMALTEVGMRFAFDALREELAQNGAINKMILALNLETLQNADPNEVDNNAVIMYVPDSNPEVLTKICQAIKAAKEKQPNAFKLTAKQLASVKTGSTAEFMVPLDDTTAFVEVEKVKGGASYHSTVMAEMRKYVYRGFDTLDQQGLPNMEVYNETLNYRPKTVRDSAKIYDSEGRKELPRRYAMPGLVTE